ncbi:2-oxoglutarate dehydrogenase complex dihydrolipoyllysine-residue succinyltransferase [Thiorhodovibrio frisius]|uniref:Dihydrolipoyllysine-residue succinyltransferase component of 2-oxoglutarate dehydrogenase complex n=1 Tax=Thiorhodovibrio frisius TaxID=631362 RepID=H8Z6C8_9GAMM|nr:2-oxoglutarate dehydrogenase complex dihydrolipoyllysine-residue succinyltransferase [Thiorhodovibrio frisius]EIC20712.1 2-oxoglutarate dehydrogenase complex dihydrolipoamide succinyltransferase [Thiorhodovibrio frisius]WPL21460.1 Dihydrolipoyllysine-residue succinyltransferase component of 2-oxoglutarate dehydrogenase complex [Thiorhodovibrio frisius]
MTTEVHVPVLPESVADATILEWHKAPGDPVRANENLVDLETDKVVLEVPAPCDGILRETLVKAGETVTASTLLARIDETQLTDQPPDQTADQPDNQPADHPIEHPAGPARNPSTDIAASDTKPHAADEDAPAPDPLGLMAPAARRLIKELGLDPTQISGSGRDGRVHKADVLAWLDRHEATDPQADADQAAFGGDASTSSPSAQPRQSPLPQQAMSAETRPQQRVPMTRLRARIAERLLEAQRQTAALTTFNEVDMSAVMALRHRYREEFEQQHGTRLGIMAFFVKAAVAALRQFPLVNATIDGSDILYQGFYDIGIAVSTERGLVVPILRDCDRLSLAEIESGIASFGGKARDGSLSFDELTGGTFSITNGGVFGSMLSTPIINPPQSAILGMHKIEDRPVAIDGQVVIRPMMYLALSYDHRLIDGREAVRFLVAIKNTIEDPARLLLNL